MIFPEISIGFTRTNTILVDLRELLTYKMCATKRAETTQIHSLDQNPSTNSQMTILHLPDEVLTLVFKYLKPSQIVNMQLTHRRFVKPSDPVLWKSIYIYDKLKWSTDTSPVFSTFTFSQLDAFLHVIRSRRLKKEYIKEVYFYSDEYPSLKWLQWFQRTVSCKIGFARYTSNDIAFWLGQSKCHPQLHFHADYHGAIGTNGVKSLRIDKPTKVWFEESMPKFSQLTSLSLTTYNAVDFKLKNPMEIKHFCCLSQGSIGDILSNFQLEKLVSLRIPNASLSNWNKTSQILFSIEEIELRDGSLQHLPFYTLKRVFLRLFGIDTSKALSRHRVKLLSVPSLPGNYEQYLDPLPYLEKVLMGDRELLVNRVPGQRPTYSHSKVHLVHQHPGLYGSTSDY